MSRALKVLCLVALVVLTSMTGLKVSICSNETKAIATLDHISVNPESKALGVSLKPTSSVRAGYTYQVELYEREHLRSTGTVTWSQIQANALEAQYVFFSISSQETDTYAMMSERDLRKTFSVKVHE